MNAMRAVFALAAFAIGLSAARAAMAANGIGWTERVLLALLALLAWAAGFLSVRAMHNR